MIEVFLTAFVTLFVVIDPLGVVPIFGSLTEGGSPAYKRRMAVKSILIATFLLGMFAFGGRNLLGLMGIGLDAFRVAGGVMLFLIALEMVFERRTQRRKQRVGEAHEDHDTPPDEEEDISVFPMAIPLIVGPGTMATIMLQMVRHDGDVRAQMLVLGAGLLVLALTLIAFLAAAPLMRLIGKTVSAMITRLLGVLLAALSAQLIVDGLKGAFGF